MPKKAFLPNGDMPRKDWLNHFVTALMDATRGYAVKYNILAATITKLDDGRQWVNWVFANPLEMLDEACKQATAFKNQLISGTDPMGSAPTLPT